MTSINLSRRAILAGVASAVALPAASVAVPASALPLEPIKTKRAPAQTPIAKLWREHKALTCEYNRLSKVAATLEAVLETQLPAPHPSIVYSPEQEADGLVWKWPEREPAKFIHPVSIENKMSEVAWGSLKERLSVELFNLIVKTHAEEYGGPQLTGEQAALYRRLQARLELARAYEKRQRSASAEIGLEKIADWRFDIKWRLLEAQPQAHSDMTMKLPLYKEADEGGAEVVPYLMRDLRVMLKNPAVFAVEA
jgi:hypothetical protein